MRVFIERCLSLLPLAAGVGGCGGDPCRSQAECPIGYHCVLDLGGDGFSASGECRSDCLTPADCPAPESSARRAICTNEGRCRHEPFPPRLVVNEPEEDALFGEETRRIRISGEVESAAARVGVTVQVASEGGCFGDHPQSVILDNPTPGQVTVVPFVVDGVRVDPGRSTIEVEAAVEGSRQRNVVRIEIPCEGCAEIELTVPAQRATVPRLELPVLAGMIRPAVSFATWRVHSGLGDVIDGSMAISQGGFFVERIPLFVGANRLEVVVSGVGQGLGESRCSVPISSSVVREQGLRALLTWDTGTSDLDIHLVGPGGRYGDPVTSLTQRSEMPFFGGNVVDDFSGFGPEILTVESLPEGVYGFVVEPVFDGDDPGSNAFLRVLNEGRLLTPRPVGPAYVSAYRGQLWVAGTLTVTQGIATFTALGDVVPAAMPPTRAPEDWPSFY